MDKLAFNQRSFGSLINLADNGGTLPYADIYAYDLNGNTKQITLSGQTTTLSYDDEDRLTSILFPDSHTDTFTYNGLGLRVGKTDPTGTHTYICDGASPSAAVLSDGAAVYTPGLSEHRLSGSYTGTRYAHADMLGSLTFLSNSAQASTAGYGFDAYGSLASSWFPNGADPTPFGWLGNREQFTTEKQPLDKCSHLHYNSRHINHTAQAAAGDLTLPSPFRRRRGRTCEPDKALILQTKGHMTMNAALGPKTTDGKAIASRNATTHGLFARDVVIPTLGEDPRAYQQLEAEWISQLTPRNLLEHHYVEKIAAASWRLRRLHRWQAQLFEDQTLTEDERLDRLDKVMRHEIALHRQIDSAVKMLNKDVPQLHSRRVRDQVLEEAMTAERECRDNAGDDVEIELETRGRLRRLHWATETALEGLSYAPLDTAGNSPGEIAQKCENELPETANRAENLPSSAKAVPAWPVPTPPAPTFLPPSPASGEGLGLGAGLEAAAPDRKTGWHAFKF